MSYLHLYRACVVAFQNVSEHRVRMQFVKKCIREGNGVQYWKGRMEEFERIGVILEELFASALSAISEKYGRNHVNLTYLRLSKEPSTAACKHFVTLLGKK